MTKVMGNSKSNWCEVGQCKGTETTKPCPGKFQKFVIDTHKGKSKVTMLDVWRLCPCKCHGKVNMDEVVKTRRPRRK